MDQAEELRKLVNIKRIASKTQDLKPTTCRIVTVSGGKGGVGKTSIVANIALALAERGLRVGILDADFGLSNVDIILGLTPKKNLSHVLLGEENLSDIVVKGPKNIKVIPASSGIEELTHLSERLWQSLMNQLASLYEELDVLLVDTAAGIGKNVINFAMASQELVLVVTPEPTSIADTYAMTKVINKRCRSKTVHYLINRTANEREAKRIYMRLEKLIKKNLDIYPAYFGWIPKDDNLTRAVIARQGIITMEPTSPASMAIYNLAKKWHEAPPAFGNTGNIKIYLSRVKNLMQQRII